MEKIIVALDPAAPEKNTIDFSCYLAALTKSKVTGVFLDNPALATVPTKVQRTLVGEGSEETTAWQESREVFESKIELFRQNCIDRGVAYAIHYDHGDPAEEMISESRFADLMVVEANRSFGKSFHMTPTYFVQRVLEGAECPVIIAPGSFESVDEIVFAYNESASSLFAIKQFTYLFPQLCNRKVSVIHVSETGVWEDAQKTRFIEWLKEHYTNLHFKALKGDSDNALFDYLFRRKNLFLVMGAYGRTAISRFFKQSAADFIIKTITQPIFIAHH